jgi:GNAT superfamily N-acetyltransferase
VPATPADVPLIHGLMRGLAVYEKIELEFVSTPADLERALFGEPRSAEALVGSLDGKAVGFALFYPTYSPFAGRVTRWLEDLFVRPAARGSGVGGALLSRLAAIAVERGANAVQWEVLDWNEPAIGFYRSLGVRPLTEWTTQRLTGDALTALAG